MKKYKKKELDIFFECIENNEIMGKCDTIDNIIKNDFFSNLVQFDTPKENKGPDIYSIVNNKILIIEHFEIDSSKRNDKGTEYKKEKDFINKKFEDFNIKENLGKLFCCPITKKSTVKNLFENLKYNYKKHYEKIDLYIKNLTTHDILNKEMKITVCFLVEVIKPYLDIERIDNRERERPHICFFREFIEFLELFEKNSKIDGIFFYDKFCYDQPKTNFIGKEIVDIAKKRCEQRNFIQE